LEPPDVSNLVGEVFQHFMRVVDIKKEHFFMEQYMNLRNRYADALLTACVDREGTEKWLAGENVEVRGLAEGDKSLFLFENLIVGSGQYFSRLLKRWPGRTGFHM